MAQFSGGYGIRPYGHVGAGNARPQAHCGSHRVPRTANGRPYNAPVIRRGAFRMRPRGVEDAAPYKHCCFNKNTSLKKQQKSLDIPPKIR